MVTVSPVPPLEATAPVGEVVLSLETLEMPTVGMPSTRVMSSSMDLMPVSRPSDRLIAQLLTSSPQMLAVTVVSPRVVPPMVVTRHKFKVLS